MKYQVIPISIYPYLTYSYDHRLKQPDELVTDIREAIDVAKSNNAKLYALFIDVAEGRVYSTEVCKMLYDIDNVIKSFDIEYDIILDGDNEKLSKITNISNIIYSDFLVITSYTNGIMPKDQELNQYWNHENTKGLWTMGRAERPHRITVLSKLWENKTLDKLDWSCYIYDSNKKYIQDNFLSHYDNHTYEKFIKDVVRSLDFAIDITSDFVCSGYPFDPNIYKNTSFSVISESDFTSSEAGANHWTPKITEKTYRTIINKHPYICSWFPGMTERLKEKGYKTFVEYAVNPNYNNIEDFEHRVNETVKTIETFHSRISDSSVREQVNNDVEYNFNHYLAQVEIELKKFEHIFSLPQLSDEFKMTPTRLARFCFPRTVHLFGKSVDTF